jgi:hypothetical protein
VTDIADATDMLKLETLAIWAAWVRIVDWLSTNQFDVSTDGQSLTRSQRPEQGEKRLAYWESKAAPYMAGDAYAVTMTPIVYTDDPIDAPIRYHALRYGG